MRRTSQFVLAALLGLGTVSISACAEQPAPKKQKKKKKDDPKGEAKKGDAKADEDGKAASNEKAE